MKPVRCSPCLILALVTAHAGAAVWYVDDSAPSGGNGTSWTVPFNTLQAALTNPALANGDEVRVGFGTYKPAGPGGARTTSFTITKSITLRGGYYGYGSSSPDAFSTDPQYTVLSGDLNGDDGANFTNNAENSLRVVLVNGLLTVTLEGFTIGAGNANSGSQIGAGMTVSNSTILTARNCTFMGNSSSGYGGGVDHSGSPNSNYINCRLVGNRAVTFGGGMSVSNGSGARLVNCGFYGNILTGVFTGSGGGGLYLSGTSTVVNCVFSGNVANGTNTGGGSGIASNGTSNIVNCTFSNNTSNTLGGALHVMNGTTTLSNSILWGNSPAATTTVSGTLNASYCDSQSFLPGTGNLAVDPKFTNAVGIDGVAGTVDDALSLRFGYPGSPCLDAGNNSLLPLDFADVNQNGNTAEQLPFDITGNPRRFDDPLTPDIGVGGPSVVDLGAYEMFSYAGAVGSVVYVDPTGYPDSTEITTSGESWSTALANPASAAYIAGTFPGIVQEIRIAGGTYRAPASATNQQWISLSRTGAVMVRGGYAGRAFGAGADIRDIRAFPSILSGDVGNNDGPNFTNRNDNAAYVMQIYGGPGHLIEGLQFRGGGTSSTGSFAGGLVDLANATLVRDCVFTDNQTISEGGGYDKELTATPSTLVRCDFIANRGATGGGAQVFGTGATFVSCRFLGNSATKSGGGLYGRIDPVNLVNCLFAGNTVTTGAGMGGGGVCLASNSPASIRHCTFTGNTVAVGPGGALAAPFNSPAIVTGTVMWGDSASSNSEVQLINAAPAFSNCIIQGGFGGTNVADADPRFVDANGPDDVFGTADDNPALLGGSPAIDLGDPAQLPADTADLDADANTAEPLPLDLLGNPRTQEGDLIGSVRPDAGCAEFPTSVINLSTAAAYPTIGQALASASNGQTILGLASSFAAEPSIYFNNLAITVGSTGDIAQPVGGLYTLANGARLDTATDRTCSLAGELRVPPGAAASLETGTFNQAATGKLTLFNNSTLSTSASSLNAAGSLLTFPGATLFTSGSLTLAGPSTLQSTSVGSGALSISGATNWTGSSISASSLTVSNTGRFTGSGNIYAPISNSGRVYTIGNSVFVGNLTNNAGGIITVQIGTATLIGTLVNNGTINGVLSNPPLPPPGPGATDDEIAFYHALLANLQHESTDRTAAGDGIFIRGDYVAAAASSLSLPDAVWRLTVSGAYDVAINSNANYDMRLAELVMAKPDTGGSTLEAMSLDRGAVNAGLDRTLPASYPIGTLRIGAGASVSTTDARDNANDGQAACEAVYCENLIIESGATLTATSCRVYYKTLTNHGTISTPANVIRVPPPCGGADFNHDGVVNTADLTLLLLRFGQSAPTGSPAAAVDLNTDGVITTADLTLLLLQFGRTCA